MKIRKVEALQPCVLIDGRLTGNAQEFVFDSHPVFGHTAGGCAYIVKAGPVPFAGLPGDPSSYWFIS